jgi:hypothetical protein
MQETIAHLVKLQAVELERTRLNAELKKLPVEIVAGQTALAAAEKQAATAQAALDREEKLRAKLEAEIDTHRKKAAKFKVQLDAVTNAAQAAAIEHEIEFSTKEADRLEAEAFESLERTETEDATLATARAAIAERQANLVTIKASAHRRSEEFKLALVALEAERAAVRPLIEESILMRFDRIAASRGIGLAKAENQQCNVCRMGVRPQVWIQLREGELLSCDSCGRMLYWDPAMAPAPAEDRPELVPGAGQALRRPK